MRLIDADALRKDVEKDRDASDMPKMWYQGVEYAINHIIHAPTVDPMKHGHWIEVDTQYIDETKCSNCGVVEFFNKGWKRFNFCPNCGSKMDEVTDGT